jgi:aminoglycoside phosphotransferase family enzyme
MMHDAITPDSGSDGAGPHGVTGALSDGADRARSEAALRYLLSPAAHPDDPAAPELIETHMAWVVLDAQTVLKLKKPVRVPPLYDCRSLEAREREVRAELRLNRRLAPDVYLGLLALRSDGERFALCPQDAPVAAGWQTVDWLVRMRRLPRARMLDQAIAAGSVQPAHIEALALVLARFWQHAMPSPVSPQAHLQRLADELQRHRDVLLQPRFALDDAAPALDALARAQACEADALARRVRQGRIVDGHGDLRPEHVCLGEPAVVIDCLTFNDALRQLDPFEELAGLALECDRLGAGWIGPLLIERCIERLDDDPGPSLRRLYAADRALLRARLAAAHLLDDVPREPQRWLARAQQHLRQARQALAAP